MSLADIAAQLNPGGAAAVRAGRRGGVRRARPRSRRPRWSRRRRPPSPCAEEEPTVGDGYQTVISSAAGGAEARQSRPPIVPRATDETPTPPAPERVQPAVADPLLPFAGPPSVMPGLTPRRPARRAVRPPPAASRDAARRSPGAVVAGDVAPGGEVPGGVVAGDLTPPAARPRVVGAARVGRRSRRPVRRVAPPASRGGAGRAAGAAPAASVPAAVAPPPVGAPRRTGRAEAPVAPRRRRSPRRRRVAAPPSRRAVRAARRAGGRAGRRAAPRRTPAAPSSPPAAGGAARRRRRPRRDAPVVAAARRAVDAPPCRRRPPRRTSAASAALAAAPAGVARRRRAGRASRRAAAAALRRAVVAERVRRRSSPPTAAAVEAAAGVVSDVTAASDVAFQAAAAAEALDPTPPPLGADVPSFVNVATVRAAAVSAGLRMPTGVYASVAAALGTGKHLLLIGTPGSGKTALALAIARAAAQEGKARGATIVTGDPSAHIVEAASQGRWVVVDELDGADFETALAPAEHVPRRRARDASRTARPRRPRTGASSPPGTARRSRGPRSCGASR